MKDIEELKSWFEDDKLYVGEYVKHKINQLDEPEVLSQEWIDKHKYIGYIGMNPDNPFVHVKDLQNLVVPKQELPVIPKFVAEWIANTKYSSEENLRYSLNNAPSKVNSWLWEDNAESNFDIYARAWLDGYTVEEEPLYYALVKGHELIADEGDWTCKYWKFDTSGGYVSPSNRFSTHGRLLIEMSKSEWNKLGINDSNADIVKVKEMEE